MSEDMKIGIVGCGKIVDFEHAEGFKKARGAKIVSLCDVKKKKIDIVKKKFALDATGYTDFKTFLGSGLDAVVIATPNSFHYEQTMAAFKAGLHVLCEKPVAAALPEANRMIAAAKKAGKVLHINQSLRYHPIFQKIRELVEQNKIGEVIHLRCVRGTTDTPDVLWSPGAKWFVQKAFQGGLTLDIGIHISDLMKWVCGSEVDSVAGRIETRKKGIDVPDNVNALFEFENGATASLELSWTYGVEVLLFEVYGTTGAIRMGSMDEERPLELIRQTKAGVRTSRPKIAKSAKNSQQSFVDAIRGKAPSPTPGELGRDALAICDAIQKSDASGRFEKVKHF